MFDSPLPSSETLKPHDIIFGMNKRGYYELKHVREVKEDGFSYLAVREKKGDDIGDVFEMKYRDIDRQGIVVFMRRNEKEKGRYGLEVIAASSGFNNSNRKLISYYINKVAKEATRNFFW